MIIYKGAFAFIIILAVFVLLRLCALTRQLAKAEINKNTMTAERYQSAEAYLLYSAPNFPLSALIKILPGTFVGLGILGTFLGFSNGISGMNLTSNVDELFGMLDAFFSGLNTAFITSIVGVVLSVVFGTFCQWPLNSIKFHCARIYSELAKAQMPAEATKSEFDVYIGSLQEMTRTLLTAKEAIEKLPEKFQDVGRSLEESVAPVKATFSAMQVTLENYFKQAAALQNASEQIQQSLTKFIDVSGQTTEKVNQSLERTITATQTIQEHNAQLTEDHKKMLSDYTALQETLSSVQSKIKEEISSYSDAIKEHFTELLSAYSEQGREILQKQTAQMMEERKAVLGDYEEIDENIAGILETVNNNLAAYSATVEKTLLQTLEEYNKTAQKVTESFFGAKK